MKVFGGLCFLLLFGFIVSACATAPSAKATLVAGQPDGKAWLLVTPEIPDRQCELIVQTDEGEQRVSCNSPYLMFCDAQRPSELPFCKLVKLDVHPVERGTK